MKILLINPRFQFYKGKDTFPIALGYLATIAKKRYDVSVIDANAEKLTNEQVKEKIIEINPDVIALTSTTPSYENSLDIAKISKEVSDAKIIIGGVHVTFCSEDALNKGLVDIAIRGEGEETFSELLECFEKGYDLKNVLGISFKEEKIIHNSDRPLIKNLDDISFPAYKMFPLKKYRIISIATSRGCPFSCKYCCASEFWKHSIRYRSAENVLEELKLVYELGFRLVKFQDSTFTLNKKRAKQICRGIIENKLDLKWSCETRADSLDEDLLKIMAESGCALLCIGVDSGSQNVLDASKRSIEISNLKFAFENAKRFGIRTRAYVTFGLPGEDENTVKETLNLLKEIKPDQILASLATAYPGTELIEGKTIGMPENWAAKFGGHGRGAKLFLTDSLSKEEYKKLAEYFYSEIRKITL